MAQLLTLKLTRSDPSNSWGFRLQGGKDFGTPLLIQKVSLFGKNFYNLIKSCSSCKTKRMVGRYTCVKRIDVIVNG